jgi:hypothetical protein
VSKNLKLGVGVASTGFASIAFITVGMPALVRSGRAQHTESS